MLSIYDAVCNCREKKYYFSWKLKGDCNQADYRICVTDSQNQVVWDSGVQKDFHRHNVLCEADLKKGGKYQFRIVCHNTAGEEATAQGKPFYTEIEEWKALWIEPDRVRKPLTDSKNPHEKITELDPLERLDPAVYFRKEFAVDEILEQALLYVSAHGIYTMWLNGTEVSDLFAPGYTSYNKRLEYQCYDVTPYLKKGTNVLTAIVADGWYTGKIGAVGYGQQYGKESALLFQLEGKSSSDKKEFSMISDETVHWTTEAFRYADLFIGTYYDAQLEQEGFQDPGFDEVGWKKVNCPKYGYENLELQTIQPVEEVRTITPRVFYSPSGELLLDAGENVVGYVGFELELKKDEVVSFEHSETLDKEGNFLQNIIGHNKDQKDFYRCKEDGVHTYKPSFTQHGFRYVRVEGTKDTNPKHYTIYVVETPMEVTGTFTCSDDRLNQLQENILRSQKGNMICIPTDCPQREKTGWTGDAQVYAATACYEQNVENFLRHWLDDMRLEQLEDGQIPHIIPYIPSHDYMKPAGIEGVSAAGWSDAAILVPWRLYEAYGDKKILEENFEMIQRYMDSVSELASEIPPEKKDAPPEERERQKYLWNTGFQYGDWLMPSIQMSGRSIFEVVQQTGHIVATLMYAITTEAMEKICHVLEKEELAERYRDLHQKIAEAFRGEYILEDHTISKNYQGVYVLALQANVLNEEERQIAIRQLVHLIRENGTRLDTGFLSVNYLLPVLAANGETNLAKELLFQDKCPSWLYEVKMGATTMWEYWNGYAEDGTPDEGSMNHFAFGCVGEYLYRNILGISYQEAGFGKVKIAPDFSCGLSYVKGSYDSIWGKIEVAWKRDENFIQLDVVLPPDVEAEIQINGKRYQYGCGKYSVKAAI